MNKGFTLIELLLVIVIVAATSLAAAIVFSNVNKNTVEQDLQNTYLAVQRAAKTYVDLHETWNQSLLQDRYVNIALSELKKTNYLTYNIVDPIEKFGLSTHRVRVCITPSHVVGGFELGNTITTCIYDISNNCVANNLGEYALEDLDLRPCCAGC